MRVNSRVSSSSRPRSRARATWSSRLSRRGSWSVRTGSLPSSRARAMVPMTALPDLIGWNCHSVGTARSTPRPARSPVSKTRAATAKIVRQKPHVRGRAAKGSRIGLAGEQHRIALENVGSSPVLASAISCSFVLLSRRRARPAIVALRAAWRWAILACRLTEAASWLVTTATANRTMTVTMSFGSDIRNVMCGAVKKKL